MVKTKVSERQEQGELTTDDGRLIIDEQEYKALSDLKEVSSFLIKDRVTTITHPVLYLSMNTVHVMFHHGFCLFSYSSRLNIERLKSQCKLFELKSQSAKNLSTTVDREC